jgi:class 3 adenylate cyclase
MSQEIIAALQEELELKRRELDLILAIDHIRDTAPEPAVMLSAIVKTLVDHLQLSHCAISLFDQESGQIRLKAISTRNAQYSQLSPMITPELAERAAHLDHVEIWEKEAPPAGLKSSGPARVQIAGVPIIMGEKERLGALILIRPEAPFSANDIKLIRTAESMVDSAVIQGYAHYELKQHVKELEAIYRIDHIRDQGLPLDEMLNVVLQELCQVINAEIGFTMLYDKSGEQLDLRAATRTDLFQIATNYELINRLANESLQKTTLICYNALGETLQSLMCLPLILNEQIIGVLGVINRRDTGSFNADDRRLLSAIGSQIDTAIFENIERRRLRQVLGRSVDPRVMERLLANPDVDFLRGERTVMTVLYADLRGSTYLAEHTDPELLVGFINHYLGQMTDVILSHEGTLDKFVGDEVMALFGAPFPQADHALRAVQVGLEMQRAHQTVMEIWRDRGVQPAPIGVGIATGELIVGEMGCSQRADYTVIGRAANLGARICSAAQAGEVLISQETYDLIKEYVDATPITGLQFKGVQRDVTVYRVNGLLKV